MPRDGGGSEGCIYKPGTTEDLQQSTGGYRESWNRFSSSDPKEPALPAPWFWTSHLQNDETIKFPVGGTLFVMAAPLHHVNSSRSGTESYLTLDPRASYRFWLVKGSLNFKFLGWSPLRIRSQEHRQQAVAHRSNPAHAACFGKQSFTETQPHSFNSLIFCLWPISHHNCRVE